MRDSGEIAPADAEDVEDEALAVECTTIVLETDDEDEDAVDPNSPEYRAAHGFLSAMWGADTKGKLEDFHFVAEKKTTKGFLHFPVTGISSAVSLSFNRSDVGQTVRLR